jgi:hypothetical protein
MRDANTQNAPNQRSWIATKSTARRSKGATDHACEQLSLSRAHSERLRSVRGCGTSHNRRTMAGQPAADAYACPEWRRRREQQHKCALSCRELSPRSCRTSRLRSLPVWGPSLRTGVCVVKVPPQSGLPGRLARTSRRSFAPVKSSFFNKPWTSIT